ncbi:MAG TPA: TraR/DksA family transcriptional regulator [Wenzhouxiangellaceae bacterium]|nr:TraR/DksA family transcriptional regulator [Wenzhouxiangellaceae bacterium]
MARSQTNDWRRLVEKQIAELSELSEESRESQAPVELDQTRQGRLSRMDALQGQAMAQATDARRRRQILALKAALVRIDSGEFGECLECGEPIAEARLNSNPALTMCIDCASERERG